MVYSRVGTPAFWAPEAFFWGPPKPHKVQRFAHASADLRWRVQLGSGCVGPTPNVYELLATTVRQFRSRSFISTLILSSVATCFAAGGRRCDDFYSSDWRQGPTRASRKFLALSC